MIRLLLTVASAAAVVWFVGSRPGALAPEPEDARQVIERAAQVVGQVVGEAGARAADALAAKGADVPAEPVSDEKRAVTRPAPRVVAAERELGPESEEPVAPPPGAASGEPALLADLAEPTPVGDTMGGPIRETQTGMTDGLEFAGPLDAERAALVRERLDRVMALAAGPAR
ncbi:MAG: hypothetical protein JRG76_09275 [Deltaproteobacteria bacterium]|nr:hypothetical protein [Deltaproteobacteria bacterium]